VPVKRRVAETRQGSSATATLSVDYLLRRHLSSGGLAGGHARSNRLAQAILADMLHHAAAIRGIYYNNLQFFN
jgi:hypothetical protein